MLSLDDLLDVIQLSTEQQRSVHDLIEPVARDPQKQASPRILAALDRWGRAVEGAEHAHEDLALARDTRRRDAEIRLLNERIDTGVSTIHGVLTATTRIVGSPRALQAEALRTAAFPDGLAGHVNLRRDEKAAATRRLVAKLREAEPAALVAALDLTATVDVLDDDSRRLPRMLPRKGQGIGPADLTAAERRAGEAARFAMLTIWTEYDADAPSPERDALVWPYVAEVRKQRIENRDHRREAIARNKAKAAAKAAKAAAKAEQAAEQAAAQAAQATAEPAKTSVPATNTAAPAPKPAVPAPNAPAPSSKPSAQAPIVT